MQQNERVAAILSSVARDDEGYIVASDPGGTARAGLRVWLWTVANGRCVSCGESTNLDATPGSDDRAEIGHLLPARTSKHIAPYVAANQCRYCNRTARDRGISDMTDYIGSFRHIAGIPTQGWPTTREMRSNAPKSVTTAARRANCPFNHKGA